jgi:protein involved in polysaccharide export with SLBB domain
MIRPDQDDVVVCHRRGNPQVVYVLGTPTTPEQFSLRTREEAVTQAVAFARRQCVRGLVRQRR